MFGHKLCLPIDLIFGTNITDLKGNHITYIENLKKRVAWAYETANGHYSEGTGKEQMML